MRELTRRILAGHGYQVITAVTGLDAIEIAASRPSDIDVLLTDVVMPQMLGKEVADRIRALRPAVKVLFMSGYTEHPVLRRPGFDRGAPFLQKPFTKATLTAKVREVLQ